MRTLSEKIIRKSGLAERKEKIPFCNRFLHLWEVCSPLDRKSEYERDHLFADMLPLIEGNKQAGEKERAGERLSNAKKIENACKSAVRKLKIGVGASVLGQVAGALTAVVANVVNPLGWLRMLADATIPKDLTTIGLTFGGAAVLILATWSKYRIKVAINNVREFSDSLFYLAKEVAPANELAMKLRNEALEFASAQEKMTRSYQLHHIEAASYIASLSLGKVSVDILEEANKKTKEEIKSGRQFLEDTRRSYHALAKKLSELKRQSSHLTEYGKTDFDIAAKYLKEIAKTRFTLSKELTSTSFRTRDMDELIEHLKSSEQVSYTDETTRACLNAVFKGILGAVELKRNILAGPRGGSNETFVKLEASNIFDGSVESWSSIIRYYMPIAKKDKETVDELLVYLATCSDLYSQAMETGSRNILNTAILTNLSLRSNYYSEVLAISRQN